MSASGNPLSADLDHILDHTRNFWDETRGARFFVTGGTGFVGCWLLESFAWANERLGLNAQALVLTRNPEAFAKKAPHLADRSDIGFQIGDVRDFTFPSGQFSHVIHAADQADAELNVKDPETMLDTIVLGTTRTLDFSSRCKAQKFLLTSSGSVYGKSPNLQDHDGDEYSSATNRELAYWAHREGKKLSELSCVLHGQRDGIQMKLARCFAFVGPYLPLDKHFAIGNFIGDAIAGRPITISGDGTPYRSYLYAADLAIWLWTILFRGSPNCPYNVGSAEPVTIAETAAAVSRVLPGNVPVNILKKPVPGQPAQRYVPDTTRAQRELGLKQFIQLEDAIQRTARWHSRK